MGCELLLLQEGRWIDRQTRNVKTNRKIERQPRLAGVENERH